MPRVRANFSWSRNWPPICALVLYWSSRVLLAESHQELNEALIKAAESGEVAVAKDLLDRGADPNAPAPKESLNPLQRAVRENHIEIVKLLLDRGANPRPNDYSVLGLACDEKHEAIARLLLEKGLDVNERDSEGRTLLYDHFGWSPMEMGEIDFLLRIGADPNIATNEGVTPLMKLAASTFSQKPSEKEQLATALHLLLKHGAKVNLSAKDGATALTYACDGGSLLAMRILVEAGADVNAQTKDGLFPLEFTLRRYDRDGRIQYLIDHGADVKLRDNEGFTTLMAAIDAGYAKEAAFFLKQGVDPMARLRSGHTVAHMAASYHNIHVANNRYEIAAEARDRRVAVEQLQLIAQAGIDLRAVESEENAPLHAAAAGGYVEALRFLLERGCDPNATNGKGESPILLAMSSDLDGLEKVKLLVNQGAQVNASGPEGKTPLLVAAQVMHRGYLMFLLRHGADANVTDSSGAGALVLAAASCGERTIDPRDYTAIIKALVAASSTVEQRDSRGMTPLMWSAISNVPEAVVTLLDRKPDVNARSSDGRTALMWAACAGANKSIRELVARGADPHAKDNQGRRALDWAEFLHEPAIPELQTSE